MAADDDKPKGAPATEPGAPRLNDPGDDGAAPIQPADAGGAAPSTPAPAQSAAPTDPTAAPADAASEAGSAAARSAPPQADATSEPGGAPATAKPAPQRALAVIDDYEERDGGPPPPPMPPTRSTAARTLETLEIGEPTPVGPDSSRPIPVRTPTPAALRWAGASLFFGLALGAVSILFAAPGQAWVGLVAFVALMLLTLAPARLIAATRSEGRSWVGWLAVWAMTLAALIAGALIGYAEWSGLGGPEALESLSRSVALLALAGLTLAPVLRSRWSLRVARLVAAFLALWALAEAILLGLGGALANPGSAAAVFFDPTAPDARWEALLALGAYMSFVWPHAPLLALIPALLAPRAAGGSFLIAGAVYALAGYAATRFAPGAPLPNPLVETLSSAELYAQSLDGVRRLIGACLLATPAVAIAALAASNRRIQPGLVQGAAALLLAPMLAADIWSFASESQTAAAGFDAPIPRATLDFVRGVGAIAFLGLSLLGALWLAGLAAFGRRTT